MLPTNWTPKK